jgi:TolB-like protein/Flp pilus assembly protein TadD
VASGASNQQSYRLDSWKEIAGYLHREVRTVIRWEKERGLPVHRLPGGKQHGVFAYTTEIDAWLIGQPGEHPEPKEPIPRAASSRRFALLAAALVAAGLLTAFGLSRWQARRKPPGGSREIRALAVLPLANLSGDPAQDYIADGLTEALITDLAQVRQLRIVSRTSAERYKGTRKPLPEIAGELNVDAVVEGSVARAGGRTRITIQLIEARKDTHLWAKIYEGESNDVLALEDSVARAIAQEIQVALTPGEQKRLASVRVIAPEAQEAYLKGRYLWNQRTPESLEKSLSYYHVAIQKDPNYAQAYEGLAETYTVMASNDIVPAEPDVTRAKSAAEQALKLDPDLAEAHATLAQLRLFYDWDFPGAEREFRRALEHNPNSATAHHWYALLLMVQGRFPEASAELEKARELDPLSKVIPAAQGLVYVYQGQYDRAIAREQDVLAFDRNFADAYDALGLAYQQKHMYREAITQFEKYVELSGRDPDALMRLGSAYALAGDEQQARRFLGELESTPKGRYTSPCYIAMLAAALGDKDRAFAWLKKAVEQRSSTMLLLGVDPAFDPLRADPRFQKLLRRVGLSQHPAAWAELTQARPH